MKNKLSFLLLLSFSVAGFLPLLFAPSSDEGAPQACAPRKPAKQADSVSPTIARRMPPHKIVGFPGVDFNIPLTSAEREGIKEIWNHIYTTQPDGGLFTPQNYATITAELEKLFDDYANIANIQDKEFETSTLKNFLVLYPALASFTDSVNQQIKDNFGGVRISAPQKLAPRRKYRVLLLQKFAHQTILHARDKKVIARADTFGFMPNIACEAHSNHKFYYTNCYGGYTITTLEEPVNDLAVVANAHRPGTEQVSTSPKLLPIFCFRHTNEKHQPPALIKDKGFLLTLKSKIPGAAKTHFIQINIYTGAVEEPFFATQQLVRLLHFNTSELQKTHLGDWLLSLAEENVEPQNDTLSRLFVPLQYHDKVDEAFARLCWVETLVEEARGDNSVAAATAKEHLRALTEKAGCTTAEELVAAVEEEAKECIAQNLEAERLAAEKARQEEARKAEEEMIASLPARKAAKARKKAQKKAAAAAKRAREEARKRAKNPNADAARDAKAATAKSRVLPEKLQQKFDDVRAQQRVRFRDLKRLLKHVLQTCGTEQLSVTRSGSHTTLHLPGSESFTIARPHGKQDLSIPAQRVADDLENLAHTLLADLQAHAQTQNT